MTRRDVARAAGISPAVVSYVLNGGPRGVAPETREKVLAAVERLGYRPNRIARSLRLSRTHTFGLVVPDNSNPYFAELARAVEAAAFAVGYTLLLGNANDDEDRQTAYVQAFIDHQVDGLLLIPSHDTVKCLPDLERAECPWVIMDRPLSGGGVSNIMADNFGGAELVVRHLLEHRRSRVGCIAGPTDTPPTSERVAGWRAALQAAGISTSPEWLRYVPFGRKAGYQATRELLRTVPDLDSIFATSDEQAIGALRAIAELGLTCPRDVVVAGFDGITAGAYAIPALTTAQQPFRELGEAAVARLLEKTSGQKLEPTTVTLPVELLLRGSCGCPDPPGGENKHINVDDSGTIRKADA